jgi:dimethylglycine dehydrogenase
MLRAMDRVPAVAEAGVKRVINGPMIWSPDSAALFGPVPELRNYFCCNGIIPGFSQSGGLGLLAAEWMIEGEPHLDMFAWDLARFGPWADAAFTRARVEDQYAHRFKIHFPGEERAAGRPARTRPAYDRQSEMGAVFGLNSGWEHPLWFATAGEPREETAGFDRQNWFEPVGREVRMLREKAGIIDISNFARTRIKGPGARAWLDALLANRVPSVQGRTCLAPLIGKRGGVAGDFTVTCLAPDDYFMVSSGMAERYHHRFFNAVPMPDATTWVSQTDAMAGFNIAGPLARTLLQGLTNADLSNEAFPFLRSQQITLAGVDCIAIRVSFTGDLGWELHCDAADQLRLYDALLAAGEPLGAGPVGGRALGSLRIEKGYGSWGREYSPEYWPQESGLAGLIKIDKDFLNKDAYLAIADTAPREILRCLEVDATTADASGTEPIFDLEGNSAGTIRSGAYGYHVGSSLALAYLRPDIAPGTELDVMILGTAHRARVLAQPAFDTEGKRLRG